MRTRSSVVLKTMRDASFGILLSVKNKNRCLGIEIQAPTQDSYFKKDLKFLYLNMNEYHKSWMFRWMFGNLRFL